MKHTAQKNCTEKGPRTKLHADTNKQSSVTLWGVTEAHIPLDISNIYFTASWDPWTWALDELIYSQGPWTWALHLCTSGTVSLCSSSFPPASLWQRMGWRRRRRRRDKTVPIYSGLRTREGLVFCKVMPSLFTAASLSVRQTENILKHIVTIEVSHEKKDKLHFLYLVFKAASIRACPVCGQLCCHVIYWGMCWGLCWLYFSLCCLSPTAVVSPKLMAAIFYDCVQMWVSLFLNWESWTWERGLLPGAASWRDHITCVISFIQNDSLFCFPVP